MKRIILFLIVVLPLLGLSQEQTDLQIPPQPVDYSKAENTDPAVLLQQASQHYMNQAFEKAILLYEQILASGKESAEVYFNLGNAYYKNNQIAQSLLNYERAKLLDPANDDIEFNIRMANQFTVDNLQALPEPFFIRWRTSVVNRATADTWAKFSLGAFFIFLIMLGTFLFSRYAWIKRLTFWSALILLVLSAFTFSFANRHKKALTHRKHAIVFCPRVAVKSAPSVSGTDLFIIHEGLKVEITDSLNSWKEIRIPDGNKGWMPDSCTVRI